MSMTVNTVGQWLEYVETLFESLTVGETLGILMDLGFQQSRFKAGDGNLYPLTDLGRLVEVHDDLAREFDLTFWGGPPDVETWYKGTMVTWAIDALLYSLATTDGEHATAIITSIENIWDDEDESTHWDDLPC